MKRFFTEIYQFEKEISSVFDSGPNILMDISNVESKEDHF
jgi:hypothetical protein